MEGAGTYIPNMMAFPLRAPFGPIDLVTHVDNGQPTKETRHYLETSYGWYPFWGFLVQHGTSWMVDAFGPGRGAKIWRSKSGVHPTGLRGSFRRMPKTSFGTADDSTLGFDGFTLTPWFRRDFH